MGDAADRWRAAAEDPSRLADENNRLRDDLGERDEYIARLEMRYENDANGYAEREKQLIAAIDQMKAELAAAPHGDGDADERISMTPDEFDLIQRGVQQDDFNVTGYVAATDGMDEQQESAKPKRDLIVAASPNGLWNVWEQQARGNYELVAGPFNSNELAHAAADEIRAEEDTSNDLAGDASDIDRMAVVEAEVARMVAARKENSQNAIRERLLQPFLGSEAEKLGATKYQLRCGEWWWSFYVDKWLPCNAPTWHGDSQYRLAKGEEHAATD